MALVIVKCKGGASADLHQQLVFTSVILSMFSQIVVIIMRYHE